MHSPNLFNKQNWDWHMPNNQKHELQIEIQESMIFTPLKKASPSRKRARGTAGINMKRHGGRHTIVEHHKNPNLSQ